MVSVEATEEQRRAAVLTAAIGTIEDVAAVGAGKPVLRAAAIIPHSKYGRLDFLDSIVDRPTLPHIGHSAYLVVALWLEDARSVGMLPVRRAGRASEGGAG